MNDLAKLRESNLKIDAVNKRLDALGQMLVNSSIVRKFVPKFAGFNFADDSIEVTTVFQTDNVTVTLPEAEPKSNICEPPVSKSIVAVVPEGVVVGTDA